MIFFEFFNSNLWRDVQVKFYTLIGFLGSGTTARALTPDTLTEEQLNALFRIDILTKYVSLISYLLAGIVSITIIVRFFIYIYDRHKGKIKE